MDASKEALLDKIAKLQAKAKGTTNEHEAAIFAAKVQEMLAEHNLTEAQLRARDEQADDPVDLHMHPRNNVAPWRRYIANGCANLYFCQLLLHGKKVSFTGKSHNAEVAMSMWDWLCSVVVRMAREYSSIKSVQEDFKRGAAVRLQERLNAMWREQVKMQRQHAAASAQTGTTLPVLYDMEGKAVADFLERKYGTLRGRRSKGLALRGGGAAAGYDRAGGIQLNTQVRETRSSRMIGKGV